MFFKIYPTFSFIKYNLKMLEHINSSQQKRNFLYKRPCYSCR